MIAGEENEGPSSESLGVCAVADGGNGRFGLAYDGDEDELMGSVLAEGREAMAAASALWPGPQGQPVTRLFHAALRKFMKITVTRAPVSSTLENMEPVKVPESPAEWRENLVRIEKVEPRVDLTFPRNPGPNGCFFDDQSC